MVGLSEVEERQAPHERPEKSRVIYGKLVDGGSEERDLQRAQEVMI